MTVDCKFFGPIAARTTDGEHLHECASTRQPAKLCHETRPESDAAVRWLAGPIGRETTKVACCETCKYRVSKEAKKQTWEEYLASTKGLPGTILHDDLHEMGYDLTPDCPCRGVIQQMNAGGVEWCRANEGRITDAMVAEGKRRKVTYTILWIEREPTDEQMRSTATKWVRAAVKKAEEIANGV